MRIIKTLLFSTVITLLLVSCSADNDSILVRDFDVFTSFLHMRAGDVCDSLTARGYDVDKNNANIAERVFGTYSLKVTLVTDSADIVDCIYLSYFPAEDDAEINNDAIESLVRHIGREHTLNNNSHCHFAMMTSSPDHAEEALATTLDDALLQRDALDSDPSYDYYITYYWLGTDEKMKTVEQLYDYIYRYPDTVRPNEAGITIISSLRNTEFPRRQLTVSFSCYY